MNKNPPKKAFDCVEMKRRIQEKIAQETEGMTNKELLQYFRKRIANSRFADLFPLTKTPTAKEAE
ncbi:MAG: hypothetical protein V2A61_03490, partial [Calditrichota bacterium]